MDQALTISFSVRYLNQLEISSYAKGKGLKQDDSIHIIHAVHPKKCQREREDLTLYKEAFILTPCCFCSFKEGTISVVKDEGLQTFSG